ncbi:MAG: acyl-ACP--UDP-N-acetylglucosamine O-acyltransferase [Deltaproteobacteria bacterium]|nr:acyl-ACP--UDP-N-acetylglucosamine O-acyltransferase [Deltaproteobacteria bacterium]
MIHPTAIIDPKAKLASNVKIGAYTIVGPDVEIGADSEIQHHVVIEGPTTIGSGCRIFPFASIGLEPQDKKFHGEASFLVIGNNNTIREHVTINRGTEANKGETRIGDNGWIMACCHIAHDCVLGDHITMSNGATLGGHVTVEDHVIIGGLSGVHQFCKRGQYAMIGGQSMVPQDIAPFSLVAGNRARLSGVNFVGLKRNGFSQSDIDDVNLAYSIFFRSGLTRKDAIEKIKQSFTHKRHIKLFTDFVEASERGVCR